ncbi:hypothetical protein EUGRSUZ_F04164 [Eucalyptus grandis]|uniref:Uncharacterized protein n=2 Tax=Eucalyptus grandis TaxID=71139 RepID=A0ACC3KNY4_EUCGR|nr:hypothetical protein EUGRSUZ_F04164 [Eucalyptus grandis]
MTSLCKAQGNVHCTSRLTSLRRDSSCNGHCPEPCADPANAETTPTRESSNPPGDWRTLSGFYSKAVWMGPLDLTWEKGCGVHL